MVVLGEEVPGAPEDLETRLTPSGRRIARSVIKRHWVISDFITMLGVDEETAHVDAGRIERHVHGATLQRFERLAEYLQGNPQTLKAIQEFIKNGGF